MRSIHRVIAVAALVGLPTFGATSATAQTADGLDAAISGFVVAFNNLDMPKFLACFAEDATVFHPPSPPPRTFPTRIQGRREIERTFQVVFDQIRQRSGRATPPYMNLQPEDLLIQRFDSMAVVTFHLGTPAERARRTLVFRRAGEGWTIVHLHASIFDAAQR
ncbi:MAG: nuclear transport factor 2 family protein [Vicinamibacterales bacterium]